MDLFRGSFRKLPVNPDLRLFVYNTESPEPKSKKRALLLIDPQNDFIAEWGSLKVPGAIEDSVRVAEAIRANIQSIDSIFVTLDTHQRMHIAHPLFWKNKENDHPKPFTQITSDDLIGGVWTTVNEGFRSWALFYVKELEKQKKFKLIIWPEHCLVGSKGHAVFDVLIDALHEWEGATSKSVSFLMKGNNALTEHYSAFKAEVIRETDPHSSLNIPFIKTLDSYDEILVAGQAMSHCVNYSVRDLVENLPAKSRGKIRVLSDGCSTITGFEEASKKFQIDTENHGVKFVKVADAFQ